MKEQRNKYIKVRMTPEEVRAFKEKSAEYKTVSHYVRKALEEYSNVSIRRQLELMQELGSFYRRYQSELSHIGGNLNQAMKRANELAVAGLLPPSYIREVLLPVIRDTQNIVNGINPRRGLQRTQGIERACPTHRDAELRDSRTGRQTHHGGAYRLPQEIQFRQQPHPETAVPCGRQLQRP